MSDDDILAPKARVNWRRLLAAAIVLIIAAVLGMMGALGNWFAFALGEVTTDPPSPTPAVVASPSPTASPSPEGGGSFKQGRKEGFEEGFKQGRAKGRVDGNKRGRDRGFDVGKKKGYQIGYDDGFRAGYASGFDQGHTCERPKPFCKSIGQ